MTELTRGQKLANTLYNLGCTYQDYEPSGMDEWRAVVDAIDNAYPKHTLYIDQPIPTITQEMVDSAYKTHYNAQEDYICLMEEYLRQHGWVYGKCDWDFDVWMKEVDPGFFLTYMKVEDAYWEQVNREKE